ncbi:putative reverse transcriptase domain-containing protein [Tanacetum coccineum]
MLSGCHIRKEREKPKRVPAMQRLISLEEANMEREKRWKYCTFHCGYEKGIYWVGRWRTSKIMDEAYKSRYSVHPGANKMYYDLQDMYWWPGMKRDIATYCMKLAIGVIRAEYKGYCGLCAQDKVSKRYRKAADVGVDSSKNYPEYAEWMEYCD